MNCNFARLLVWSLWRHTKDGGSELSPTNVTKDQDQPKIKFFARRQLFLKLLIVLLSRRGSSLSCRFVSGLIEVPSWGYTISLEKHRGRHVDCSEACNGRA